MVKRIKQDSQLLEFLESNLNYYDKYGNVYWKGFSMHKQAENSSGEMETI